jgi:predicted glutamine amidotransferase
MEKIIDRETKVLMLQVLKQGYATDNQRAMIVSAFSKPQPELDLSYLTDEERAVMLSVAEKLDKQLFP